MPQTGEFHLAVPVAFILIAQLGIIHGCVANGIKEKRNEIYLREIRVKCRKEINSPTEIKVELCVTSSKVIKEGILYKGNISINNGSFIGEAIYVLPTKNNDEND